MSREEIIRLAEKANCGWTRVGTELVLIGEKQIERFAALVAASEREACALILDSVTNDNPLTASDCAEAIRARGQE